MSEMRSKNLFVILCIPNFFELDRYVAMHRSTGLLHIYKRGNFGAYNYKTKKKMYLVGKKYYSYSVPPDFIGRFTQFFPLPKDAYELKKQTAINEWSKVKKGETRMKEQRDILIHMLVEINPEIKKRISEAISTSMSNLYKVLDQITPGQPNTKHTHSRGDGGGKDKQ